MPDLLTVDEVKDWLDIASTDTTRDDRIQSLIGAASDAAIRIMARDPLRRTRTETVNGTGGETLPVNHFPIRAVTSVTLFPWVTNAAPIPADQIGFDDNVIIWRCGRFPYGKRNVQVVYNAGLDRLPQDVRLGLKYTVKAFWDARLMDMNSTAESFAEVGGAGFWPSGPGSVPPQAVTLFERAGNKMKV